MLPAAIIAPGTGTGTDTDIGSGTTADSVTLSVTSSVKSFATAIEAKAPPSETEKADSKQQAFNILLIGVDSKGAEQARSDVILLVRVVPATKKAILISVPRDTQVHIAGVGATKINHAHILGQARGGSQGGVEAVIQAVSDLFQLPIHYYAKTNFSGFEQFIDEIGGVSLDVPHDMLISDNRTLLAAGPHHLDGARSLDFVRERYSLENGDWGRQTDQSLLLKAVVQKLLEPEQLPSLPSLLARAKNDWVETNFTESDLLSLAWLFKGFDPKLVSHIQLPGHSAMGQDPLVGKMLWYWIPDLKQISEITQRLIKS
ncbi:LCP family protein [Paenibacillus sp. S3N08]|uniref:LCP family protein n=2 Tax=Paenibacillus agricola TaxID=2716264 RepID=A0ABX0J5X0_9BACL|nr:LCP family protein [Paenibacillus agricola]